jgi:hypothetical protein
MPFLVTLVMVEIRGPKFVKAPGKLMVVVSDREKKKTLTTQTIALSEFRSLNNTRVSLPILLYNTSYSPIIITTAIHGLPWVPKPPTLIKELLFGCGE